MSFIKIQLGDDITFIDPNSVTAVYQAMYGSRICCGFTTFSSEENAEHLIQRIETARTKEPETIPKENFYFRSAERLPDQKDGNGYGELIVSDDTNVWFVKDYDDAHKWNYWAPVPKVEAKA